MGAATIELLDARSAADYRHLAVGLGQGALSGPLRGVIAVGAAADSHPAGLLLVHWDGASASAGRVLILRVNDAYQGRGIGRALLAEGERVARAAGCLALRGAVAEGSAHDEAIRALLRRAGWSRLRHLHTFYKVPFRLIGHAPWVIRRQAWPIGVDLVPWSDVPEPAKRQLRLRHSDSDHCDSSLDPFWRATEQTSNSVGLLFHNEIAGWAVSWPLGTTPGTMVGPRLFVRPDLRPRGYAAMLLAAHIAGCPAAGIDAAVFYVEAGNRAMMRWMSRNLRGYVTGAREHWDFGKVLTPAGAALLA